MRDGDDFLINGQKVFISNGQRYDVLVLATKTDSAAGAKSVSLFLVDAAMAKMITTELHCETADKCLQLFGGWGYIWDYPIGRAYADARIVKIAGGSIEIMKTIIARDMFKGRLKRLNR